MTTSSVPGEATAQARATSSHLPTKASAAKIVGAYAAAGAIWMFVSGSLVHYLVTDGPLEAVVEMGKSWAFVGVTAALLWVVLDRYFRMLRRSGRLLEESEARWKQALAGASQTVWEWAPQSDEAQYSPEWKAMLGYEPQEIGNELSEWSSRVHPEDLPRVLAEVQRHLDGETAIYLTEHRIRCKDGTYKWILDCGKVASRSPDGQPLRMVRAHSDISWRKQAEEWNRIKHDLMQALAAATRLDDGLRLCLDAAMKIEGMDSGGFYLVEDRTGALNLSVHRGFSPAFLQAVSRFEAGSSQARLVAAGKPLFVAFDSLPLTLTEAELREGLGAVALIPVSYEGRAIGCMNVASHTHGDISPAACEILETIAAGAAQAIVRLHAQEALRASAEKHRGIFDESVTAIYVFDQDKHFVDSNQAGLDLLGYSRDELLRMAIPDVDADPVVVLPAHQQLLTGGRLINYEHRLRRKDGSVLTVLNNSRPLTDANGQVVGMQSTLVDITQRRRAEQSLQDSENNFRTFFQTMDDLIVVVTPEGRIVFGNASVERKLGFSSEELATMNVVELHPPEVRGEAVQIFTAMLRRERPTCPLPLACKDGRLLPVETRAWFGQWNGQTCLFGVCKDLSAEQEAQQRFERLFRHNPLPLALSSLADRRITDVNDAWVESLGYRRSEVIGKTSAELHLFPDREQQQRAVTELQEAGRISEVELQIRTKDGTIRDGLFSGEMVHSQGRSYFLTVMVDVTERKRTSRLIQESEERFRALFANAPDGLLVLDAHSGTLVAANPAAVTLFGASSEAELCTHVPRELTAERQSDGHNSAAKARQIAAEAIRNSFHSFEWMCRRLNGREFLAHVQLVRIEQAQRVFFQATVRDITASRAAQRALENSQRVLRMAMEVGKIGVFEVELATGRSTWSSGVEEIWGLPAGFQGDFQQYCWDHVYPDDLQKVGDFYREFLQHRQERETDFRIVRPGGAVRWLRWRGRVVCDEAGVARQVVGMNLDINDRKRLEEERESALIKYRTLFDNLPLGVLMADRQGRVVESNRAAEQILGVPLDERLQRHVGEPTWRGVRPDGTPMPAEEFASVRALREQRLIENVEMGVVKSPTETTWISATAAPVPLPDVGVVVTLSDISHRKQAEEEAAFEATRRRALIEGSRDGIVVLDPQGKVFEANRQFAEMLGYTAEEVRQLHVWDWDREWPRERVLESIRRMGPEGARFETRHVRKDGSSFDVDLSNSAVELAGQKLTFCVCHDITARKQAEAALRESLLFRREAEKIARIGAWKVNPETDYLYWTEGVYEIVEAPLDYKPGLREGMQHYDAEAVPALREALAAALKDGTPFMVEAGLTTFTGKHRWTEVRGLGRVEEGGQSFVMGTFHDITERKQTEMDLRASEERHRTVLDAMIDSIHVVGRDQRIVLVNHACRQWCARAGLAEPRPGQALKEALPFLPAGEDDAQAQALATGAPVASVDKTIQLGDKELIVDIRHIPIGEYGQINRIMTVIRDVTEHKKLEGQFLRAQRIESLGTLAAGIAHDLNNVLTPVMMLPPLIRGQIENKDTLSIIDSVDSSVQRGADIIKQLLVFSRGVEGEQTPLRLGDVVKEIVKMAREVFPRNLTIQSQMPRDLWLVSGNSTHLHQVLLNLSVNARDAMPQGGTLTYSGENTLLDVTSPGLASAARPGAYVVLKVHDTGTGIPADIQDKIFDPFFTTKEVGKGTGLGLSTVQGIVRSHGGFVEVSSEQGRGTEFRVFLPALTTPGMRPVTAPAEELVNGDGQTILVVDDEAAICRLLQRTLEEHGYRVLSANDGIEALNVHQSHPSQIAAVLTDLAMPRMNGLSLTRSLKHIAPHLPVIVATGQADDVQRAALDAAGVKLLLDKPFQTAALLAILRKALTQ